MLFIKLTFLCVLIIVTRGQKKCTNTLRSYEDHLGTKTPYRFVANLNTSQIKYEGCEPTKMWALVRHGTRNPSAALIEKMQTRLIEIRDLILENIPLGTDEIHNSDLDLFRAWNVKLQAKDEKKLTHEGEDEMMLLAERLQRRFPKILSHIYSDTSYKFKYTATQRTRKSAEYFSAGLFGKSVVRDINYPEPLKRDPILRFYKLCQKWKKEIKQNPEVLTEMRKFHNSTNVRKVIEDVNKRLGFKNDLDISDIHAMYMTCAFETAWNKRKRSPWCSVFTLEDFKVLEYAEDLKYYWIDGFGHEITYKQACKALVNFIEHFQSNETFPKAVIYFTHSGTLLKMLAHLNLYRETGHLLAEDYRKNDNRKWRVSQIDSFATNLVFVLFNCQGEQKILTLHQEHIVQLPSCPDSDLCSIDSFLSYYNTLSDCPFDEICDNE